MKKRYYLSKIKIKKKSLNLDSLFFNSFNYASKTNSQI